MDNNGAPFSVFGHLPKETAGRESDEIAALRAENLALIAKLGEQAGRLAAMTAERDAAKKEIDEWRDLTISTIHKWASKILEAADYSKRVRRARRQRDEWRERAQVPDDVKAAMDKMGDARCVDGGCPLYLAAMEFWMAWDEWRGPREDEPNDTKEANHADE